MFIYGDRARTLCDEKYVKEEFKNVEQASIENGYTRRKVQKATKEIKGTDEESGEQQTRGLGQRPNISQFTTKFKNTTLQWQTDQQTKSEI